MSTKINISRKLESVVPKSVIKKEHLDLLNPFGKWTATLFYVSHKKCILATNSTARYTIIIDRVKKSDFENLTGLFIKNLYNQLLTDGIEVKLNEIIKIVGEVKLFQTDNDRGLIGTQNYLLEYLEDWKYEFGHIDNWPFREINKRINEIPSKQLGWLFPHEKMKIIIDEINTNA